MGHNETSSSHSLAGHLRLPARPAVILLLIIFFPFHFGGFSILSNFSEPRLSNIYSKHLACEAVGKGTDGGFVPLEVDEHWSTGDTGTGT